MCWVFEVNVIPKKDTKHMYTTSRLHKQGLDRKPIALGSLLRQERYDYATAYKGSCSLAFNTYFIYYTNNFIIFWQSNSKLATRLKNARISPKQSNFHGNQKPLMSCK
jgi:hypothetical protein